MKKKFLLAIVLLFIMSLALSIPVQAAQRLDSGDYILSGYMLTYAKTYTSTSTYKFFKMKISSAQPANYTIYNSKFGVMIQGSTPGGYQDVYIRFETSGSMDEELMLTFTGNGNLIYWIEGDNYYIN